MPVARIANAFNLRTIAYPLGSFLLGDSCKSIFD
jgi:hypothetical protein